MPQMSWMTLFKPLSLALVLSLMVGLSLTALAEPVPLEPPSPTEPLTRWASQLTPTTIITVTSGADPDDSQSTTCYTTPGPGQSLGAECTLRRALVEASSLDPADRPVLVSFDLGTDDPTYDSTLEVWTIALTGTLQNEALPRIEGGQVIIDGATQPGGRTADLGPKIIIRGPGAEANSATKRGLVIDDEQNEVRGLGFQHLREVIILNASQNTVADNWFGLTADGLGIAYRAVDFVKDGSGQSGVLAGSGADANLIQNNVLLGLRGAAIDVQGENNQVLSNTVGTRSDGTVPAVRPDRKCQPNARADNWFPGAGIDIGGNFNEAAYNRVVGMLFDSEDPQTTPDNAFDVTGTGHLIHQNIIGLTSDDQPFGTCAVGISLSGAGGVEEIQVLTNTIVGAQGPAIFVGGTRFTLDQLTLRANVTLDNALHAIDYGTDVPVGLKTFNPAAVTNISGTAVEGTAGADSPCANCLVELFLDAHDTVTETQESLALVTADGDGNWSATLPRPLAITEGLRTASTSVITGQIDNSQPAGFGPGMTSKFSEIYVQAGAPDPVEPPPSAPPAPPAEPLYTPEYGPEPTPAMTYSTIVTVTSAGDFEDVTPKRTCSVSGAGVTPLSPCTLKRAINEASFIAQNFPLSRPIRIQFSLPVTDNFDATAGVWTIELTDTLDLYALPRMEGGHIILDGENAIPGGRPLSEGPHIFIKGPEGVVNGLVVDNDGNEIRNLGFQNFNQHLIMNGSDNIISDNWFGLSVDGQTPAYRTTGFISDGSGTAGVTTSSAGKFNLVENNKFLAFRAKAIDVESDDSVIRGNWVGARADGTVPEVPDSRLCKPNARYHTWFGGGGIIVTGLRNQVDSNHVVALLFDSNSPVTTPDNAIEVNGSDHRISNNVIGVTSDGVDWGTCGRGIVNGGQYTRILSNTIANAHIEAIGIYGTQVSINSVLMQGNVIRSDIPPVPNINQDLNAAEAIIFGPLVPEPLQIFTTSQVITFTDSLIAGENPPDNACPYCRVELFLDDLDPITEAFESLGVTTTDANGQWSFPLESEIPVTQGVRVINTSLNYGTIENFDSGTSTDLSQVFSRTDVVATPIPGPAVLPPSEPLPIPAIEYLSPPSPPLTYVTIITVTTTDDSDGSLSTTCADVAASECTLRFAINQVNDLTSTQRPALIAFNIPESDPGYSATEQIWVINFNPSNFEAMPPVRGGQVTIDGRTQPTSGRVLPSIILQRDNPSGGKLAMGETSAHSRNMVQGLIFQNVSLSFTGGENIIRNNWLGLTADGQGIYFYGDDPNNGNQAIINGQVSGNRNLIEGNRLAGSTTDAINLQSDDNFVYSNTIGLRLDGTLPTVSETAFCNPGEVADNWFGGGGLYLAGDRNQIKYNTIAGLLFYSPANATPDPAIQLTGGQDNLIQHNQIGVEANGQAAWTCGGGVTIAAEYTQVLSNTISNAQLEANLFVNGDVEFIVANQMRYNVLTGTVPGIFFGPAVPSQLQVFTPAMVTQIDGQQVYGTAVAECPFCAVDVYLDNQDSVVEAWQHLGTALADANGDWSLTLPAPLGPTEGLRTVSTARDYGVVESFEAGTSSALSELYFGLAPTPLSTLDLAGSSSLTTGVTGYFTATITPVEATRPITYHWQATEQNPLTERGETVGLASFTWDTPGQKLVTVTVSNPENVLTETLTVTVLEGSVEPPELVPLTAIAVQSASGTAYLSQTVSLLAQVSPLSATLPITYTWQATGLANPVVGALNSTQASLSISWPLTGTKLVTVTAVNAAGVVVTDVMSIVVSMEETGGGDGYTVFLPLVLK